MLVKKASGVTEQFEKKKIIRTCLRMRASPSQAREVANRVENRAYDGISTKEILQMIFSYLKDYRPEIKHQIDLREAISLLRPKPDFEMFVQTVLSEQGYIVSPNAILTGKCVDHEIDAIAKKDGYTILVEVKHHINHHTYTGVDIFLETYAKLEDLRDGSPDNEFDKALVVCNTKFSDHAIQYATCKGIECIGWNYPVNEGLERMIEEKKLYPITLLKDMDRGTYWRLADNGVILLKDLVNRDANELSKKTKIPLSVIKEVKRKAEEILEEKES
jgi:hypothetical protein